MQGWCNIHQSITPLYHTDQNHMIISMVSEKIHKIQRPLKANQHSGNSEKISQQCKDFM